MTGTKQYIKELLLEFAKYIEDILNESYVNGIAYTKTDEECIREFLEQRNTKEEFCPLADGRADLNE